MSVAVALVAIVVTLATVAAAVVGSATDRPRWALPALVPVVTGLVVRGGGIEVDLPGRGWAVVLGASVLALGVAAGGPLSVFVLRLAAPPPGPTSTDPEVLRGGATIGLLERLAVVGAAAVGRFEIVAAVVAVKGLGRFRDLDGPVAREQFIIGTLASLSWAAVCAGLVFAGRW